MWNTERGGVPTERVQRARGTAVGVNDAAATPNTPNLSAIVKVDDDVRECKTKY